MQVAIERPWVSYTALAQQNRFIYFMLYVEIFPGFCSAACPTGHCYGHLTLSIIVAKAIVCPGIAGYRNLGGEALTVHFNIHFVFSIEANL